MRQQVRQTVLPSSTRVAGWAEVSRREPQRPEEVVRQQRQARLVPDFRPEQEPKLTGFERAKDHDTCVRALDLIEGNFCKLDEAEGRR